MTNKWFIGIKKRGDDIFNLSDFKIIDSPKGEYYADPFIYKDYLFFELYDYDKGRLAYSKINEDLTITEPIILIDSLFHQSFPSVIEIDGEIFMTPEGNISGELAIYKAIKFPDVWEKICIVERGRFDDPILYKNGNEYQIYCTEGDNNFRLFVSDKIDDGWKAIKRDCILYSRSAGHIFRKDGKLIRPTQNCTKGYGYGIIFKELTTNKIVHKINPDWHPDLTGTHTFNVTDDYVVIDGRIKL